MAFQFPPISRIQATTISPPSFSKLFRGSAVVSYTATREMDGNGRKFQSISAMPIYQYKSHEELRLEDYELKQNRENAVEDSNSYPGAPKSKTNVNPPIGTELGSIGGTNNVLFGSKKPTFGVSNAQPFAPLSSSSTWTAFGVQSSSGGSCFKTCDNQAKLFQSTTVNSPFHSKSQPFGTNNSTSTAPPLWSTSASSSFYAFGSTSASKNTSSSGVQGSSGGHTPLSSPFCFNSCTVNSPFDNPANLVRPSTANSQSFHASQTGQTTYSLSQPSQASNGSTMFTEVGSQTINGQQCVPPPSTVGMQSANHFGIRYKIEGPNAVITIQHGTFSVRVSGQISSLTILPARGVHSGGSSEPCFINSHGTFHETTIFRGSSSNIARATPEIDANTSGQIESISATPICKDKSHEELRSEDYELDGGKGCEGKACPSPSFKLTVDETEVSDDTWDEDEDDDAAIKRHEADVLAVMPKLPDGDHYTEPCIKDLAAKEMAEAGFCSRVNDRAKPEQASSRVLL